MVSCKVKYSLAMVMHRFVWSGNGVVSFSDVMYSNGGVTYGIVEQWLCEVP